MTTWLPEKKLRVLRHRKAVALKRSRSNTNKRRKHGRPRGR